MWATNQIASPAGFGTVFGLFADRLSRHHRAGPSASLDKSADQGYLIVLG
jgi:hypothetical protein